MHDEKTSAGRAKMLSRGDTGDRLAEVDEVLGCLVVQTVEHHEAEFERDSLRHTEHSSVRKSINKSKYISYQISSVPITLRP